MKEEGPPILVTFYFVYLHLVEGSPEGIDIYGRVYPTKCDVGVSFGYS